VEWTVAQPPELERPRVSRAWQWGEYIFAVLAGNVIYYSIEPALPLWLHHRLDRADPGVLLDFLICAAMYGLVRLVRWI
jgi:hypothetical protein